MQILPPLQLLKTMSADKILVTGANGQLGSVLIPHLRSLYGEENVLATDIRKSDQPDAHFELLNASDERALSALIRRNRITQVYHLAAILSAKGEENPLSTWSVNTSTFFNVLEASRCAEVRKVFFPSSIAVFGTNIDRELAGQQAPLLPSTAYGMSKAASENWSHYYYNRYGLDIRSVRYPGIVGYQSMPGGGTTDYAVDIYHKAVLGEAFSCFLEAGTTLPMIYMDDAITATLQLMEAPAARLKVRTSYNLAGMSFSPAEIAAEIRKFIPNFEIQYAPDFRQQIAESWPKRIDDAEARADWGWKPHYDLALMTRDMIQHLEAKYHREPVHQ